MQSDGGLVRTLSLLVVLVVAPATAGCGLKNAVDVYDECEATTSSFAAMIDCGKRKRAEKCRAAFNCTTEGDRVVAYGDALAQSVKDGSLTEAEARRRWIEFKLARTDEYARRASSTARTPVTCTTVGGVTNCF